MDIKKPDSQSGIHFSSFLWLIPAITLFFAAFFSYANVDTTRDYIEAYRIATGAGFPLLGQQMAFSFSVGPWWFYLLSLMLLINKSWLMIALLTAGLNAIKYYLIFHLGRMLGGKSLAMLMVVALMMVSMTLMQTITFTHTNLVESMMLLILVLTLKQQTNHARWWFLYGILIALAFHVHPTACLVAYVIFIKWLELPHKIKNAGLFMLGLLLVLLPLLINELIGEETLISGTAIYFESKTNGFSLTEYFKLIYSLWVVAPFAMLTSIMNQNLTVFVMTFQLLISITSIFSPLLYWQKIKPQIKIFLKHLWLFMLLSCVGLILIRATTPWYMTYGISVVQSIITAIGLYVLFMYGPFRKLVLCLATWLVMVFLGVQYLIIDDLRKNQIVVPSLILNDLKSLDTELSGYSYEILAHEATKHGKFTCQVQPVALHGPYSALIYSHSGMEHLSQCGSGLYYGPKNDAKNLFGVPPQFKQHISIEPIKRVGNSYFYQPLDISEQQQSWAEDFKHDYERRIKQNPLWQQSTSKIELNNGSHLSITRLLGFKMHSKIIKVTVNGTEVEAVNQHVYSSLYVCRSCSPENTTWTVEYQESVQGMTSVVSF